MIVIPGTQRTAWPGGTDAAPTDPGVEIPVTIWLRPRPGAAINRALAANIGAAAVPAREYVDRERLRLETDADPSDIEQLRRFLGCHDIRVDEVRWRSVTARGAIGSLCAAFGAELRDWESGGHRFRQRTGALHAPAAIASIVHGVFGLDEWPREHGMRPKAEPMLVQSHHAKKMQPFSVSELEKIYDVPRGDGAGEVIGILQFGGSFELDDFAACMRWQGVATPAVTSKRIDDAAVRHELTSAFDTELALDTQIAGAFAPRARLVLYCAPHSERGFLDAVASALFDNVDRPQTFSISFGWAEPYWTPGAIDLLDELFAGAALVGMSVFCASGDEGAETAITGQPLVLAPASSSFVHACGGTSLEDADGLPTDEQVWGSTGGGFSGHFPEPAWQSVAAAEAKRLGVANGRGVPDVVAQVQPGYRVIVGGERKAAGGTSAVAPFWAALTARLNQRLGRASGFYAPLLYAGGSELFKKIVAGTNGTYEAHPGWNPCAGLGAPKAASILRVLSRAPKISANR